MPQFTVNLNRSITCKEMAALAFCFGTDAEFFPIEPGSTWGYTITWGFSREELLLAEQWSREEHEEEPNLPDRLPDGALRPSRNPQPL